MGKHSFNFYLQLGPFYSDDQVSTAAEVRPNDWVDLKGSFHI